MKRLLALLLLAALASPAAAAERPWLEYEIILWQKQTAQQYAALKRIGITAGVVIPPDRDAPSVLPKTQIEALRASGLRWYVENIATDFYSAYHRWTPDHPVNWRFQQVKQRYLADPSDPAAFLRDPSLSDPRWRQQIADRLTATVRAHKADHPLFYDLADEPGIADLSIAWDFDFSAPSLAGFRQWLKGRYGTLAALNRQWATDYARWDQVMPISTQAAMARRDENFSAWADFKEWMDDAFAAAVRAGTDAVHAADPTARAAIAGLQIPGWGGYDYTRLAHAVDVMELYDGGDNWEIARSLNPDLVMLTTSNAAGAEEKHAIWRALLRGARGVILWDPRNEFAREDGTLGPRGRDAAPYLREIRGGLGALLINSVRETDPVAILYSPASLRIEWMLDWRGKGDAWARRDIDASYEDANVARSAMVDYAASLEESGLHPRFLSPRLLEEDELRRGGYRLLVLPHALALGPGESDAIRRFVAHGGRVIADIAPGAFDAHGRKRAAPVLADLFRSTGPARYVDPRDRTAIARLAAESGVRPKVLITGAGGDVAVDVESHLFRNGAATIIALQREEAQGAATPVTLTLPRPAFLCDIRAGKSLGRTERVTLALDPHEPVILALSDAPPSASAHGACGEVGDSPKTR